MNSQLAFAFDPSPATPAPATVPTPTTVIPMRAPGPVVAPTPAHGPENATAPDPRHPRRRCKHWGRYKRLRRPAPLPKPFTGYGAYRLVIAGGVAHVIGPGGVRCEELTEWARLVLKEPERLEEEPGARAAARRHDPAAAVRHMVAAMDAIRMLLDAINWVHPKYPHVVRDLLDERPGPARDIMMHWLRMRGCEIGNGRGRTGGKIVFPVSADEQWTIGVTVTRFRQLFDDWKELKVRVASNPTQMDPDRSRLGGGGKMRKGSQRRWFLDIDSLFRVKAIDRQAPRPHDASVPRGILERGREMGWPAEVSLKFEFMLRTGSRIGQSDAVTAYSLLVAAKSDRHVAMIQKGSRGLLKWQARVPADLRDRMLKRLAGYVKGGMATLRRWARPGDEVGHAKLARLYVFSDDGRAPTPAWRSAHLLRLVVDDLGHSFLIPRDDGTSVVKSFTSHWFRHAFVNAMLNRIAANTLDPARKDDLRAAFARYMGWRNPALMLEYYGRHHYEQEAGLMVAELQDELNGGLWTEFADEDLLVPANDNGVVEWGQASGDYLD